MGHGARLVAIAALLLTACATGDDADEPDAEVIPGEDVPVGEDAATAVDSGPSNDPDVGVEADVAPVDVPVATVDAGFDVGSDAGFDVGRDVGFDVGFDVGRDVGSDVGRDVGVDVGFDVGRDVGVDAGRDAGCVATTLPLAGNWRLAIAPPGGGAATTSLTWFSASGPAGALAGGAVDAFGYAELTGVTADACALRVTYTKRYTVGSSTGLSFRYAGQWAAGSPPAFAGTWVDTATASNTSTFTAQSRGGRTVSTFAGSWRLAVTWQITSTTFTVGAAGGLTGTMVDEYGTSMLQGAVDLGDGTVMFVKRYTSGTSMGQQYLYTGAMNVAGTQITAGRWSDQGTSGLTGAWTAAR